MNTNFDDINSDPSHANYHERSVANMPTFFANELVNEIFDVIKDHEGTCFTKVSDSECPVPKPKKKDDNEDMDPRLKCWNKMLKQRKAIEQRIQLYTGKRAQDVLFNRHVTIDDQSKQMLLRLLDNAKRSEGYPPDHGKSVLKMRIDSNACCEIKELQATDPQLQELEFVGLPEVTQLELAGVIDPPESQFQRSEVLGQRLQEHEEDIKRVLSYCPHIEHLQVAPGFNPSTVPVKKSLQVGEEKLTCVSETSEELPLKRDTKGTPRPTVEKKLVIVEKPAQNLIRINGCVYGFGDSEGPLSSDLQLFFQCDPFQRVRKTMVHLENIGNKFVMVRWQQNTLHNRELYQHHAINSEFVFDTQSFLLVPGHERRIDVMYAPMLVGVKKQSWTLNLQRSSFCGVRRINIRFHGICTEPACYRRRLDNDQQSVIRKRHRQIAGRLTKFHAELAPIVERPHMDCPYERRLDERELFSAQNPGFQCSRYADLETLKQLYILVKKPRQPPWDYSIETVRQCIYQHEAQQREALQKLLLDIIEPMRCNSNETFDKIASNVEKQRTCFVYVSGIICSAIDEWEVLAETLGQQFYKSELQRFINGLHEGGQLMPKDDEIIDWYVAKKVNGSKYFKDALYIQTYTILCDAAENIVSAIESTVHL
ncbi:hypothetical protein ACLKA7_012353 [Drosophila subpalustris]